MDALKTVRGAYQEASSFLHAQGIDSPSFEAELLLRHLLQVDRTRFFLMFEEPFSAENSQQLGEWLQARKRGVPLQYLVGEQYFYGRRFCVEPAVLIPRPETEILVEQVLQASDRLGGETPLHVVDVGTGSGAIAVTLALERPQWQVTAIDRSSAALQIAQANARMYGVDQKITWHEGSWLLPLRDVGQRADIILSNPPYIPSQDIDSLEKQVRDYEPHLALDGGADGLDAYRELILQLPEVLKCPGLVAFEVGEGQSEAVRKLLQSLSSSVESVIIRDLAGKERVVMGWVM